MLWKSSKNLTKLLIAHGPTIYVELLLVNYSMSNKLCVAPSPAYCVVYNWFLALSYIDKIISTLIAVDFG